MPCLARKLFTGAKSKPRAMPLYHSMEFLSFVLWFPRLGMPVREGEMPQMQVRRVVHPGPFSKCRSLVCNGGSSGWNYLKKKRMKVQGTRIKVCQASCMVRCVLRLPEFSMDATSPSPNAFKKAKADQLEKFRKSVATALEAEKLCELSLCERFIVSYPTAECPTGHDVTTVCQASCM
eukprot:scpid107175/ scgid28604/ 